MSVLDRKESLPTPRIDRRSRMAWRFAAFAALCLSTSGCLAANLASRGAPESALQYMVFELPPVDLPARPEPHVVPAPHFERFPLGGWVHGFEIRLVDGQGRDLPGELLHHAQVMMPGRRELLNPIMLRLWGAGNETGAKSLPPQVGFRFEPGDSILVTAMLHNPTGTDHRDVKVRVELRFSTVGPWRPPMDVFPFFAHVTPPPENSAYDLPPGDSERTLDLEFPIPGRILALGGHLHTYGVSLALEDVETGKTLWETFARTDDQGLVQDVPHDTFVWTGGITIEPRRTYRLRVRYLNPGEAIAEGGMGTLGGVFLPDGEWPAADPDDPVYRWDWERNAVATEGHDHGGE